MAALAVPAIALAAALWAAAAIVASDLFERGVTPVQLSGARAFVAAVGLAVLPASWRVDAAALRRARPVIIGLGLALALVTAAYYLAIERLPVAIAIVLQYTAPVLVVAAGVVFARRRPDARLLASLALAMAGVVLVTGTLDGDLGALDMVGVLAGLASAALFASYTVLGERARRELEPPAVMLGAFAVAAAFWLAVLATRGWPGELFEAEALPGVLFVGVGGTLTPFLLYVWAVAHVRAERAAIAATLEPVLAALAAWLWLGQALSAAQLTGGLLVIVAVVALQLRAAG